MRDFLATNVDHDIHIIYINYTCGDIKTTKILFSKTCNYTILQKKRYDTSNV